MNKNELVSAIATKAGMNKNDVKKALDAAIEVMSDALANGDKIALIGFGTLSVVEKGERKGRNPHTNQEITIPARKAVKFKQGADLTAKLK